MLKILTLYTRDVRIDSLLLIIQGQDVHTNSLY